VQDRPTVFVHIGAPKTGTTFLQSVLFENRAALRRAGLLIPGRTTRSHFRAAQDLRGSTFKGYAEPGVAGSWARLVKQVRRWPRTSVISHEIFAAATEQAVDRALADLEFADVHVIWTARDLARQLPAAWQERLKNGETLSFGEFLDKVRAGSARRSPRRGFWALHGGPDILARWSRGLPPERVHVVTVPPPGADPALLWRRFAGVIGIDAAAYDTTVRTANPSLSAAEAAVLRSLNGTLDRDRISWPAYRSAIKYGVALALSGPGGPSGTRIELPEDVYEWVLRWSEDAFAAMRAAGYDVAGDLADLVPAQRPVGADPDAPPPAEQVEAAGRMLAAMVWLLTDDARWRIGERLSRVSRGRLPASVLYRSGRHSLAERLESVARRPDAGETALRPGS
jgi:hypothetical protein